MQEKDAMSTKHVTPVGANIFNDLDLPDAENLKLRLDLMIAIRQWLECSGLTQADAAVRLGTSQPLLNDVIKGRYERFTIDRLVKMLEAVGKHVSISVIEAA
jgi:predicted XRE-type DNA-binding protein